MSRAAALTGSALLALGLAIFVWKTVGLGLPLAPSQPEGLWRVELVVRAQGQGRRGSVRVPLPSSGPGQVIFDEHASSDRLLFAIRTEGEQRTGVWSGRPPPAGSRGSRRAPAPDLRLRERRDRRGGNGKRSRAARARGARGLGRGAGAPARHPIARRRDPRPARARPGGAPRVGARDRALGRGLAGRGGGPPGAPPGLLRDAAPGPAHAP